MAAPRRPLPSKEVMQDLAKRMAKVDSEAREELALLLKGHTTARLMLPAFRRHVRRVAFSESPKVPMDLRTDLKVWLAENGTYTRGDDKKMPKARWDIHVPCDVDEAARLAAQKLGVSFAEYVRGVVAKAAEDALGQ